MTVAFHSPLPPARTGVADYAAALLPELRRHGRVEAAGPGAAAARTDVALYHIGNNGLHAPIYRRALECPGVVVLHDAVLHHLLLGALQRDAYIAEFVYNYGEWQRALAEELSRVRASSGSDSRYFSFPMVKRIAETSRAVVVHNPAAAAAVKAHAPGARVVEIPHLFAPPPAQSQSEAIRYRQSLGAGPESFTFGIFGYLRESKRLISALAAFDSVRRPMPRAALLVAGSFVSSDLARAAEPLLAAPGIIRLPHLSDREFWLAASALDVCINLKYPAAGETSGIAIRMMGIGKPVMATDSAESSRIPEDAFIRIPPGMAERDSLVHHMLLLAGLPDVAAAIGERGAAHIRARHRVDLIGEQYWELLRECAG